MSFDHQEACDYHLVWVDSIPAAIPLYVAGRLETTRELRKLGWHVTLVLEGPSGPRSIRGVDVLCISKPKIYFLGYIAFHLRFLRFITQEWAGIDIILFHPRSAPWLLPLRFLRQFRGDSRPLLLMDTRDRNVPGRGFKNQLRMFYDGIVNYLTNHWADGQTAITKRMTDLVHIPQKQLWGIWPSGVNLEQFSPVQTMRKWPGEGEAIHLIYIGSLLHVRNLLLMCQAVEVANGKNMKFKFSLYGDGPARADLEAFAQQTAGRVNVFAPVPHDQIPEVLAQAHIGVTSLFSPDEELFKASSPIKLFEYMASGLPILATRMACHTDVIGRGKYVFWVERIDLPAFLATLNLIWDAKSCLSEMGFHAATASLEWTWIASAKKLKASLEYGLKRHQ